MLFFPFKQISIVLNFTWAFLDMDLLFLKMWLKTQNANLKFICACVFHGSVGAMCHNAYVEIRRHIAGAGTLLAWLCPRGWTHVLIFGSKSLYLMSHFVHPKWKFKLWVLSPFKPKKIEQFFHNICHYLWYLLFLSPL